jgi:hypothetical protein
MRESPDLGLRAMDPAPQGSPFVSIWLEPGATIKQIAASSPMRLYYPLAAIFGASIALSHVMRRGVSAEALAKAQTTSVWAIVVGKLASGAVCGIAGFWLVSFYLAWIGRLLGGSGRAREVRTVLAWSSVPHIPNLALAVVVLVMGGTAVLTGIHPTGTFVSNHPLQVIFLLGNSVLVFWAFGIEVAGIKAIMGISTLRAIMVIWFAGILGILIVGIMLFVLMSFAQLRNG